MQDSKKIQELQAPQWVEQNLLSLQKRRGNMETKKVKFRETAQVLLERHGAAKSFKLLFFLKNSIFHYWEDEILGEQTKKLMLSANWLLDDVAEALLLEVFGEEK